MFLIFKVYNIIEQVSSFAGLQIKLLMQWNRKYGRIKNSMVTKSQTSILVPKWLLQLLEKAQNRRTE